MKKSSWKKFFTRSRSKSNSKSKKVHNATHGQNEAPLSLGNETTDHAVNLKAESNTAKPLVAVTTATANVVQEKEPTPKQPKSSTNEEFMTEEVESQNSSTNSQSSEKPALVVERESTMDGMARRAAFSESQPSNETADPSLVVNTTLTADVQESDTLHPLDAPLNDNSDSGIRSEDTTEAIVVTMRQNIRPPREVENLHLQSAINQRALHGQVTVSQDENKTTPSDNESEFAVDRSQPQQLSKLDVLGTTDYKINANYSESDDSQQVSDSTLNTTNNIVITNLIEPVVPANMPENQTGGFVMGNADPRGTIETETAIVLELPQQFMSTDERTSRVSDSALHGNPMLFFSGMGNSPSRNENITSVLFFGPQAYQIDDLVDQKIVYQVANDRNFDDETNVENQPTDSQVDRRGNDGQSPPSLEDEQNDDINFKDFVKKM